MRSAAIALTILLFACGGKTDNSIEILNPQAFSERLNAGKDVVLLDVRTSGERTSSGFIARSGHIDFNSPSFQNSLDSLDRSGTYFLYCASGKRSGTAAEMMKEKGFASVVALEGGLRAWVAAGLPVSWP